jgi:hypothetical protein
MNHLQNAFQAVFSSLKIKKITAFKRIGYQLRHKNAID